MNTKTGKVCAACGLRGHSQVTCNRPEGVAARGGVILRIATRSLAWAGENKESIERGIAKSRRIRKENKKRNG